MKHKHDSCNCEEDEKVKVYFCPKCKSTDIKYVFELSNLWGLLPRRRCGSCKLEGYFPLLEIEKKKLNKKAKRKKK